MSLPPYRRLPVLVLTGALWATLCFGLAPPAAAQAAAAEAPARLPPWVVPALRLVSSTHVEPTTGVVLADTGLVLVPLSFGGPDDEIVVLDGGTDIVRNGRPARLERSFPELGLKVLAVEGLGRRGARLSAGMPAAGSIVTLAAFPPAERIEEGAPPVHESTGLNAVPGGGFAPATALPNVSGALLDACGRLAGYSIADGIQTIAPADGTRYHWQPALQTVFEGLGLEWAGLPCMPAEPAAEFAPPAGDGAEASGDQGVDDDAREPTAEAGADAAAESPPAPAQPVGETPPQVLPPVESALPQPAAQPSEPAAGEAGTAGWWLGAGLLLLASGFAIHRLRMRAVADPGAARGGPAEDSAAGPPGAAHVAVPDAAKAAAECRLLLRGHYADGRPLLVSAAVSARAINLEIGRGGADLALDSPAVSRRHARLSGTAAALTLADLGSGNGSSINGVPCLEGEIMYVEPGDTVILGDVRFVVELEPGSAPGGGGNAPP